MIKAVSFDCFGVLTQEGWFRFLDKYETNQNKTALKEASHNYDMAKITYKEFLQQLHELSGVSEPEAHALISTNFHPNEPLFTEITQLKERGYRLGVLSNAGQELTNFLPSKYFADFDEVTVSCKVGAIKPDPLIYSYHLAKLNIAAHELLFIDDRPKNCDGAQVMGIQAILFKSNQQTIKDIKHLLGGK